VPLAGRLFRRLDCTGDAPGILRRGSTAITGRELSRSFGTGETKTYAIKDVSVELRQGEINLLMGPSGSGKSTLLAVLSGLLRPDAGDVGAFGRDVWRMGEDEMEQFRLRHCSYIFQGYNLFPALTAREQLEIVLKWGEGCSSREARQRTDRVLGQLGLTNKAHLRPAQLSGGEKQRVAIGRALVKDPTFVFADEPTAALDWENGRQVIDLLTHNARERNAMVLVVTHDPRLVPYADRVFELADGRLQNSDDETRGRPIAPRLLTDDFADDESKANDDPTIPLPFRRAATGAAPRLRLHVPEPAATA
jgi:putative ABC transport system ATP-binding protein